MFFLSGRLINGCDSDEFADYIGDLSEQAGDVRISEVVGNFRVAGVKKSGHLMLGICVRNKLAVGYTFFRKKKAQEEMDTEVEGRTRKQSACESRVYIMPF